MKRFLFVCAGFFVASVSAPAQAPDSRWNAYAFLAPGTSTSVESGRATLHVGGGAEAFLYQGLSLGAEIGPVFSWTTLIQEWRLERVHCRQHQSLWRHRNGCGLLPTTWLAQHTPVYIHVWAAF